MKFVLREKMLSVRDVFQIKDHSGDVVYTMTSRILALRRKFVLERPDGTNVAVAKRQILSFWPQYKIRVVGGGKAKLRRAFYRFGFGPKFIIRSSKGRMVAEGNFLEHEYQFNLDGSTVAEASKHWVAVTDTYGVEIENQEDIALILCCVVAIDTMLETQDKQEASKKAKQRR